MTFYNISEDDTHFFEYCKKNGFVEDNEEIEDFDVLRFFEGDPDIIKLNGIEGYFFKDGETVFYYFDSFFGNVEEILKTFFESFVTGVSEGGFCICHGSLPNGVKKIYDWEDWNKVKTGVAFRNGAGYYYNLFDFDGWNK